VPFYNPPKASRCAATFEGRNETIIVILFFRISANLWESIGDEFGFLEMRSRAIDANRLHDNQTSTGLPDFLERALETYLEALAELPNKSWVFVRFGGNQVEVVGTQQLSPNDALAGCLGRGGLLLQVGDELGFLRSRQSKSLAYSNVSTTTSVNFQRCVVNAFIHPGSGRSPPIVRSFLVDTGAFHTHLFDMEAPHFNSSLTYSMDSSEALNGGTMSCMAVNTTILLVGNGIDLVIERLKNTKNHATDIHSTYATIRPPHEH
jgi:hypothetical protein